MDTCVKPANKLCGLSMRIAGPAFVLGFYYLMLYHTWVFLTIIATVLRSRVGTNFAVVWTLIGIVITYNVVWNHMLAMCLKPGSPKDLIVSRFTYFLLIYSSSAEVQKTDSRIARIKNGSNLITKTLASEKPLSFRIARLNRCRNFASEVTMSN